MTLGKLVGHILNNSVFCYLCLVQFFIVYQSFEITVQVFSILLILLDFTETKHFIFITLLRLPFDKFRFFQPSPNFSNLRFHGSMSSGSGAR
ncbi:hypothetical protein LENED_000939 [Lentinula edodes]|uniref:Uncharacterized protein n=1 Tax=Lentinula edodes TaxID=5353 RepID=A0A1Q3DX22_LENED|nr:hypothetical protein LENED_000939 [Lentinula edodes]